jgi:DNA-binding NarL/FixJ family response regulator
MSLWLVPLAALATATAFAFAALEAVKAARKEARELAEKLRELSTRLEATEQEVARAAMQADVAELVLLDKGVADEEDIEALRRQFEEQSQGAYVRDRDGNLH